MQDQGDDGGADTVKNRRDRLQRTEVHIQRAQRCNDHKVRQYERPTAGPGAPEAPTQIRDENAHLDREGPWKRLTYRNCFAHLLFAEPIAFRDEFALHLADEGYGSAKAEKPESQ